MATLGQNVESVQISGWTQAVNKETTVNVTVNVPENVTADNGTVNVDIVDAEGRSVVSQAAELKIDKGTKTATAPLKVPAEKAAIAGKYTVVVTGGGNDTQTLEVPFTVNPSAQTSAEAFAAGKATAGIDQDGSAVEPDEDGTFEVVADGANAKYVVPTYVMPEGAENAVAVELVKTGGTGFFTGENHTAAITNLNDMTQPGTYWALVTPKDDESVYAGAQLYVEFTVVSASLQGAVAYEVQDDPADVSDTTFVWNNTALEIGFAVNGAPVKVDAKIVNAKGEDVTKVIKPAGEYRAYIEGTEGVYDGAEAVVSFTVEELDLSAADATVNDVAVASSAYSNILAGANVNGRAVSDLNDEVEFSADFVNGKAGSYEATFTAAEDAQNVTGTKTVSFNAVETLVEDSDEVVEYNSVAWAREEVKTFDASKKQAFDADLVSVDGYEEGDWTVTVTDKDGNVVASPTAAGTYTMTVTMNPGSDYEVGGKFVRTFAVTNGTLDNAVITVVYEGDVVSSISHVYDGSDVVDGISVTVKRGNATLVEGTDYELVYSKNGAGEVDSIVDAGSYVLTVKGTAVQGKAEVAINVAKAQITNLRVQTNATGVLPWTGQAITPVIEFTTDGEYAVDAKGETGSYVAPEDADWQVLPADQFIAAYAKDGKDIEASEVVDEGAYTVTVTPNTKMVNHRIADTHDAIGTEAPKAVATTLSFKVSKAATFADVSTDAWYADEVAKAYELTYIDGVGNNLFMPDAKMTREQFAQILANMAGEFGTPGESYPTQFTDVSATSWSAFAIMWATNAEIVNGTSETEFSPFDDVTREQIATMLYRYAGNNAQADASALDDFADGDQVSAWAQNAVAWAVENGYLKGNGEGLDPQGTATRAEVAALAVRVQPDGVPTV